MVPHAQVRCPVRILHGMRDSVVSPAVSQAVLSWVEARDVHLTLLKDGDHRLSRPQDLRALLLMVWLCPAAWPQCCEHGIFTHCTLQNQLLTQHQVQES